MEQTFFPATRREAERQGIPFSSDANKNAPFPSQLRELRGGKGISQAILAKALGVSKSTVGLWETGDTLPDAKSVHDLAVYFGVSSDLLLGLSRIKSTDVDLRAVCDYTGLSEDSVRTLHDNLDHDENNFILLLIHELLSTDYLRALVRIYASAAARYWIQAELSPKTCDDPIDKQKTQILNEFGAMVKLTDSLICSDRIHSTAEIPARSASDFYYKKLVNLIDDIVLPAFQRYEEREKELFENLRNGQHLPQEVIEHIKSFIDTPAES